MKTTPLLVAMEEKKLSLGLMCLNSSPELMEIIGYTGFNHVMIDQMFTGVDWGIAANMVRAAQVFGTSAIIRVQTYPWGSEGNDLAVASAVARAQGIGANGALISIGSVTEAERCLRVPKDWSHRRTHLPPDVALFDELREEARKPRPEEEFLVIPLIELPSLMGQIDEFVALDGLKAIGLGIQDIAEGVGHPHDVEHKEVWKVVDQTVNAAEPHGISVYANTGYRYTTVEEMVARVERLWNHGVRIIQVQTPGFLLQNILRQVFTGVSNRIKAI